MHHVNFVDSSIFNCLNFFVFWEDIDIDSVTTSVMVSEGFQIRYRLYFLPDYRPPNSSQAFSVNL